MATVPGTPRDDDAFYGGIPKELRPTQADFLIAAAMHHQDQQQRTQLAMDTSGMRKSTNIEDWRSVSAPDLLSKDPSYKFSAEDLKRYQQERLTQAGMMMQQGLEPSRSGKIRPDDPLPGNVLRYSRDK